MSKLTHVKDRVIVSLDMEGKNWHTMPDGTKIRIERKYDCFNMRHVNPVNATVISAEEIPHGSEILIHHNSCHDTNRIFNYKQSSDIGDVRYFSIPISECYAWAQSVAIEENGSWRPINKWQPLPGFDFALRIFKPYKGIIAGIEPEVIKNILYLTTGIYAGNVMQTLRHCDYQIIFQDINGREGNIIRVRTKENKLEQRESEILFIHQEYTQKVLDGDLIIGLTKSDAKSLKEIQYAG